MWEKESDTRCLFRSTVLKLVQKVLFSSLCHAYRISNWVTGVRHFYPLTTGRQEGIDVRLKWYNRSILVCCYLESKGLKLCSKFCSLYHGSVSGFTRLYSMLRMWCKPGPIKGLVYITFSALNKSPCTLARNRLTNYFIHTCTRQCLFLCLWRHLGIPGLRRDKMRLMRAYIFLTHMSIHRKRRLLPYQPGFPRWRHIYNLA